MPAEIRQGETGSPPDKWSLSAPRPYCIETAVPRLRRMPHASNIVYCDGPDSPHAFDIVPLQPRKGSLEAMCPVCKGRGQWNTEIDLVSFRCKRTACDRCHGAGWVETGSDPVGLPDIEIAPGGYPRWTLRFEAADEATQIDPATPGLSQA